LVIAEPKRWVDSTTGRFNHSTIERRIWSVNFNWIHENFTKYLLVEKLVGLLDDTARDWYANLLLSNITRYNPFNDGITRIRVNSREEWLKQSSENTKITHKDMDVIMWRNYLSRISPTNKY
jgi:hypothetical protein